MIVIFPGICKLIIPDINAKIVKDALNHYMELPYRIEE